MTGFELIYWIIAVPVGLSAFIGQAYEAYRNQGKYDDENLSGGANFVFIPILAVAVGITWPFLFAGAVVIGFFFSIYAGLFCLFEKFDEWRDSKKEKAE